MLRSVYVKFSTGSNNYVYLVPEKDDPKVGDYVITSVAEEYSQFKLNVDQYYSKVHIGRIQEVHDEQIVNAKKFYLWLLPTEELYAARNANKLLLKKIEEKEKAREELDKMIKDQADRERYKFLVESNPRAAELVKILES